MQNIEFSQLKAALDYAAGNSAFYKVFFCAVFFFCSFFLINKRK